MAGEHHGRARRPVRAIADLITAVGDRAGYESDRDSCCRIVLGWFLEAAGIDPARREALLDHAVTDRFDSWMPLPEAVVAAVAEDLALWMAVDHAELVQPPPG